MKQQGGDIHSEVTHVQGVCVDTPGTANYLIIRLIPSTWL